MKQDPPFNGHRNQVTVWDGVLWEWDIYQWRRSPTSGELRIEEE